MMDEFQEAVEIVPGRFYVTFLRQSDSYRYSNIAASNIIYSIDSELLYEPFYADFGPLNLGKTYRFCEQTKQLLLEANKLAKKLYLYTGPSPQAKANAAVLVGVFQVLYLNRSPEDAYAPLAAQAPYMPFRDASCGIPTFNLQPIDCIRGIAKARDCGFIDAGGGTWRFDLAEYEHYEQVENGDLNWIVPGKLVAFSGPAANPHAYVGFRAMVPEDYWDYYKRRGVQGIVRLNKKVYDRKRFLDGGFQHHELYFPDGSCPSQEILLKFLSIAEATPGALAIHCKAGLGRTGVLICSYIMKHYRFTAEEVIGYIRVCRPGSVIGPQQGFIKDIQRIMWMEGDAYRAVHGPQPPPLVWGITPAAVALSAGSSKEAGGRSSAGGAGTINLMVDATGRSADGASSRPGILMQSVSSRDHGNSGALVAPVTPGLDKSLSDLSLKQLQERIACSTPNASTLDLSRSSLIRSPSTGSSSNNGSSSGTSSRVVGRGMTPQRLFSGSSTSTNPGPLTGSLLGSRPASQQVSVRSSLPGPTSSSHRSASAHRDRQSPYSSNTLFTSSSSIASLRATLHTDTVSAANRAKVQPQGMFSQSSDFASNSWRNPATSNSGSNTSSRPSSTVTRVLAPNGQPRKVPAAALVGLTSPPAAAIAVGSGSFSKGTAAPVTPANDIAARFSAYYSH